MDRTDPKAVAKAALDLLREAEKTAPAVRFEQLVQRGLIDRQGRVTKLAGGQAEPAPGVTAREAGAG